MELYGLLKQVIPRSASDTRVHENLENITVHNGKSYNVEMLWAKDKIELPNNYFLALVQLKPLDERLTKDQHLRGKVIEYRERGLREGICSKSQRCPKIESRAERDWYLPHHPVVNPNKPAKVRRVINKAVKIHGAPLNNYFLKGAGWFITKPNLCTPAVQINLDVSADIEGLFLQAGVLQFDQPSLRFWREDITSNLLLHHYKRHIFGANDLPTCANNALQRTAHDRAKLYPDATKAVVENF